jgi:uncharacterized protein YggE
MKIPIWIISLFFISNVSIAQLQNIPLVVIEAEGIVKVKPDYVIIGVKLNKKIQITNATFEIFREIDTQFKIFGLDDKAISQSYIQADSSFYIKEIYLTLTNINMLDKTLLDLYRLGYKQYIYLDYRVQNLISYKNQARKEAIMLAKTKATLLASELGQNIGKAHTIEELNQQSYNWYNIHDEDNLEDVTYKTGSDFYVIEPGYITIISKVKVSFDLIK